ncbi:hypothetical protein LG634_07960 [Streptomyces bambusae]|uniref:SCO2584 family spore wall biosynthesis protein n=1 Tax=Streptomyces bambusae TaxID=1550616 RepID=UPI001CFDA515|nr:hypothetical protein [Streptomyces bambusae]MCB5164768.1 hypothetical protein [Streptomyces bambusae]
MPDDVGGKPFPDDWEPDDDRGGADQDFASVVFDEAFVRGARIHEPTADERVRAAAQARAEAEEARAVAGGRAAADEGPEGYDGYLDRYGYGYGPDGEPYGFGPDFAYGYGYGYGPYGAYGGSLRPYRGRARWHRPVAWMLAVVMGVGMVALAFTAVYRGASDDRRDQAPLPATTGIGTGPGNPPESGKARGGPGGPPVVTAP